MPTTHAVAQVNDDSVDTQVSATMQHEHGTSTWSCSMVTDSGMEATVGGPDRSLRLEAPFHFGPRISDAFTARSSRSSPCRRRS